MKKYKFYLVKTYICSPRFCQSEKNVVIEAENTASALDKIKRSFPDWQISMFWPIFYPISKF